VANYNVDIAVALKGAKKLTAFNKDVRTTQLQVEGLNKSLKNVAKDQNLLVRSFENLNTVLATAKANFNAAASGTSLQKKAARELVAAQKDLNKELKIQEQILQGVTLTGQRSSLKPGRSRTLLGQSVTPEGGVSGRSRQILAENQALQEALGSMNSRAFGRFKFMPPIQGTTESQLELKTRVSSNIAESQRIREIVAAGSSREKLGGGFKEFNKNAKKIQADTKKIRTIVAQNQAQGIQAFGNQQFAQPIGPVRPGPLGRLGIGTGANPRGMFANPRGRAGRISGGLGNALIGGGFPLLFGQGALGAAGGGIGGAVGGALGGPFGFGLSIAGTAIAQRVQETIDFQKSVDKLNVSIRAAGGSSFFTARGITQLGKQLGISKQEALQAAQSFAAFDANVRKSLLITFGDEATFDLVKGLKTNVQLLDDIKAAEDKIGIAKADQLREALRTEGSLKVQKRLQEAIIESVKKQQIGNKDKINFFDRFASSVFNNQASFSISPQITTPSAIRDERVDSLQKIEERTEGVQQLDLALERALGEKLTKNIAMVRDELEALADPINRLASLADTVGSAFGESFKGIIKGSMTAQEALRNLFMRTADHFLDMAAQMIAKQIQMSILGIGLKFFGSSMAPSRGANTGGTDLFGRDFDDPMFGMPRGRANGGAVKGGSSYLVGERGPELFSPGVSGMITPNEMLGGSTNIVVNVDASGSSVEGDEENGRELGRMISVAIQSELIKQKRPGGLLT